MAERTFTVEEANALLPRVRDLAERMVEHRRRLTAALERQQRLSGSIGGNGGGIQPQELANVTEEVEAEAAGIASSVEAIQELGVLVKDVERGLVDFPALRRGQEVLLCWRVGEDEIRYWHGTEEGFAGRKELPL